jgi:serine/threonine-protein kinase
VAWVALIALSLGVLAASILPGFQRSLSFAQDPSFGQLGLSPNLVATYLVAVQVVFALGCLLPAGVIFWRRSDNWMAMFVSLVGAAFGTNIPLVYTLHATHLEWHLPIALVIYFSQASGIIAAYLFPDGRFVPRWTRPLAVLLGGWMLVSLPFPAAAFSPETLPNPLLFLLLVIFGGTAVCAQVYRYVHVSSPAQRQQTKWVVFGLAVTVVGYVGDVMLPLLLPSLQRPGTLRAVYSLAVGPAFRLSMLAGPLTIGLSILRYRLWDIDFVINRSLVYGTLTVLLGTLFVGSLFVVSRVFQALGGGRQSVIAVALSALVFGAVFQPARRRLQCFIDQRVYGIHIDYQEAALPEVARTPARPRLGAYTDLESIGFGGMAHVYKAWHPRLNRPIAIKVLLPHLVQEAGFRERFEREAHMAASLDHPNIVQVFDYGQADGRYYIAMEYIAGPDLGSLLRERGRLPLGQAIPLVRDVAGALDYAHGRGIVHRDVKPSNIVLWPAPGTVTREIPYRAVLTDFGIAKALGKSTRLTRSGTILGTFGYVAPEQIQGVEDLDGRADVYALGVMVYQMLTGNLPFKQESPGALLIAHLMQPPPDPRDLVHDLLDEVADALQCALAKRPEQRYATAGEFAQALSR